MENLITSQDYINDDIVAEKIAARDFEVFVSPAFEVGGMEYRAVLDGHHSLAAAIACGVDPVIVELTATEDDRIALIEDANSDAFLDAIWDGNDFRFAASGECVW